MQAFSAEKCFDRLPKTPLCYQLAMYFFSLKIALEMKTFGKPLPSDFYSVPPRELVRQVEMQADELDPSSEQKKMLERMFYYGSLLLDYQESETLKNMGRGELFKCRDCSFCLENLKWHLILEVRMFISGVN